MAIVAAIPLAIQVLPLIPPLIAQLVGLIETIKHHPTTPEETKAALDKLSASLQASVAAVEAVPIPAEGAGKPA